MSDDRKDDKELKELKELKDEELDKVSGGVNSDSVRDGGRQHGDYLTVKKTGPAP